MTDRDMLNAVADAAVALQEAKEEIEYLQGQLQDYKYIHQCAQDELKDAERRIQFLEKML